MNAPAPEHEKDRHLDTSTVEADIRRRTAHSGAITLVAQGAKFLITTITIGVLGRLLTPRDFGLVTMVMVITNLLARFRTLGLESSTIQRHTISHAQVNALFWINLAFGIALTALVAGAAPLVALLYGEPPLTMVTVALSAVFLLGALSAQHLAVLRRTMRFGRLAFVDIASVTVAGVVAIAFAVSDAGYWALVAMHLTIALCLVAGVWIASPWRPTRPARAPELAGMVRFGAGVAGANLLHTVVRQVDKVLIGVTTSAAALGFYSRGYNLLLIPLQQVNYPLSNVAISALSRVQNDETRYRLVYRRALLVVLTLTIPPCVFAALFAEQAVLGVLGDQWDAAVPIFLALVPAAVAWCFEPAVRWVYVSRGRSGREFTWRLMTTIVTVTAFVVGLNWGALGVAIAFSVCAVAFRIPEIPYCYRISPIRVSDLMRCVWRPALAPIIAGGLLVSVWHAFVPTDLGNLAQLLILAPAFTGLTALSWVGLPGGTGHLKEAWTLFTERRPLGDSSEPE